MGLKIILTGSTGMVGEGVLFECLSNQAVDEVLMVNRKHYELKHPKLKELIVPDFFQIKSFAEQIKGYDACFYCAGISSVGLSEKEYAEITFDTTLHFAETLVEVNPSMVFIFVSGQNTDSTEIGRTMWARVKGKTENALGRLPFKKQYNFRPGAMLPVKGQRNSKRLYQIAAQTIQLFSPKSILTLREVGIAMIHATLKGYPLRTLEIKDIKKLAEY
ncbi:hypothetical protein DTO96_101873 [Ephemeroptericola cinctiostellae]|uniref:NAD-dependent epimerase/dehydratase domain-containing protein n=1 Tax=Ephemeroptericola cinctiostellae TaxID=2268024 RepID=A0A345DCP4_9BURK|nr:NAD-dependent epimerase/dehydratase family protein [Ephemeroptericola cinctiostellae]AXF86132.1 hypothetical protein DTO96_101873 [Ephemeroptericola cinctiostellae]